jgi:sugar O-acyltransferase (sialic acid O-acetyltransferase NeuD family)
MIKRPLIIFGAGGLGREVKTIIDLLPDFYLHGFCDDTVPAGKKINGVSVLGNTEYLLSLHDASVVIAIGNPVAKNLVAQKLSASKQIEFITVIHPRALLSDLSTINIAEGSIITAGCILTTSINIGKHVLLNLNATVGHDVEIGDYTSVMPGVNIAGEAMIGQQVLIGSGANILNRITVEDRAVIGSGAVVRTKISAGATAVGVPAKEIVR